MKKRLSFKHIYFVVSLLVGSLAIGSIANAFSLWNFGDNKTSKINLTGRVYSDDIEDNYEFGSTTSDNPYAYDWDWKATYFQNYYEYKLLGGAISNAFDFDNIDSSRTFKEVNFNTNGGEVNGTSNTVWDRYGRLYYIDKVYFPDKGSTSYNTISDLPSDLNNDKTIDNTISMKVKLNGFSIARRYTGTSEAIDKTITTNSYMNVTGQKEYFKNEYNESDDKYNWFRNKVLDPINNQIDIHSMDFYFEQGLTKRKNGNNSDFISRFNADSSLIDETKMSNYCITSSTNEISKSSDITLSKAKETLDRKFFTADSSYNYYNVLLFVPFQRYYKNISTSDSYNSGTVKTDTGGSEYNGAFNWGPLEDDFCYIALYPCTKSLSSSISSFLKIIDFSDITNRSFTSGFSSIPTVENGGYVHQDNYLIMDTSKDEDSTNFLDNGNIFIDRLNKDGEENYTYRRVYGISNGFNNTTKNYGEPTYSSEDDAKSFYLGSTITKAYTYYGATSYDKNGSKYQDTTKSLEELDISSILNNDKLNEGYKLIDHLTLEEVDIKDIYKLVVDYYIYNDDGTIKETHYKYEITDDKGIYFNKSMVLLLVQKDLDISAENLAKSRRLS